MKYIVIHVKIKSHTTTCLTELRCAIFGTPAIFLRERLDFCHSRSKWKWVYIKYRKFNHESESSAGVSRSTEKLTVFPGVFGGLENNFHIPGVSGHIEKLSVFPGVFQRRGIKFQNSRSFLEYREIICFSRSFPGTWKKISHFQEFSRNSRSSEHHVSI